MATEEDMASYVSRAADLFAEAEKSANDAYGKVLALVPLMKEGRELGLAGYLQSSRMRNDLRSAAGRMADALGLIFAVHAEGTKAAEDKGVDLPQPKDGGGGR